MLDVREFFAANGPLAAVMPDYRPRREQMEMAEQVQKVLETGKGQCVLEAGTGVGKTFAYLAPIMDKVTRSKMKVLISTGGIGMQDQLGQTDIPILEDALQCVTRFVVLKGRANYICKKAVEDNSPSLDLGEEEGDWAKIRLFAAQDGEGDVGKIPDVPADSPLLKHAISTHESCTRKDCPHFDGCFLYEARKRAKKADIVIVNHHLFLSDAQLREKDVGELVSECDAVLLDEAHLLPELAPDFFGEQVSAAKIMRLLAELEFAAAKMAPNDDSLAAAASRVFNDLEKWQEASNSHARKSGRIPASQMLADRQWASVAESLAKSLQHLGEILMQGGGSDDALREFSETFIASSLALQNWLNAGGGGKAKSAKGGNKGDTIVRWASVDDSGGNLTLCSAPTTGRNMFGRRWKKQPMLLFTSATLSVGGEFADFCAAVGAENADGRRWESPYDFKNRTLLYLPQKMPDPTRTRVEIYTKAVVKAALPLLIANGGRAFMLFTSWSALDIAHDLLLPKLRAENIAALKQKDASNDELLKRFRDEKRAVLFGAKAFWQGADVRGEKLSLVVVDKFPLPQQGDPIIEALNEEGEARGDSGYEQFLRNQLPGIVTLTRQAAGRLMRHDDDYGIFMIADPRALTKGYGKIILDALPPMPQCRDATKAENFLRQWPMRRASEATKLDDA